MSIYNKTLLVYAFKSKDVFYDVRFPFLSFFNSICIHPTFRNCLGNCKIYDRGRLWRRYAIFYASLNTCQLLNFILCVVFFYFSLFFWEISDSNTHFLYKVVTGMVVFWGVKNSIFILWMQHSSIFLKSWLLQWLKKLWWINEEKQEIGKLLITLSSNFLKFKSYHDPLGWIFIKKEVNGLAN